MLACKALMASSGVSTVSSATSPLWSASSERTDAVDGLRLTNFVHEKEGWAQLHLGSDYNG